MSAAELILIYNYGCKLYIIPLHMVARLTDAGITPQARHPATTRPSRIYSPTYHGLQAASRASVWDDALLEYTILHYNISISCDVCNIIITASSSQGKLYKISCKITIQNNQGIHIVAPCNISITLQDHVLYGIYTSMITIINSIIMPD